MAYWLLSKMTASADHPFKEPRIRTGIIAREAADFGLTAPLPDVLVEIGRDMAQALIRHPEQYEKLLLNTKVYVVDEPSYEALFFLFSGSTRQKMFNDGSVAMLAFGSQPIMSIAHYNVAIREQRGY